MHTSLQTSKRIAHVDMDAFFASVELLRYPQLKGLAVVIGGGRQKAQWNEHTPITDFPLLKNYVGRGVITTATYQARQFGIGSAMGMMKAAKLCPHAIMLPVDFARYRDYSQRFKTILKQWTDQIEDRGIDEVYMDLSAIDAVHKDGGRATAAAIQKHIYDETGLTCSIGIAPNKLLAKICSEWHKPNAINILFESDVEAKIWPLPASTINGIGHKTAEKLASLGVHNIGELAALPLTKLHEHFGKLTAVWLHRVSHGKDDRAITLESEPVSMSRETTFDRDLHPQHDRLKLAKTLDHLCSRLAHDLQQKNYAGRTIGIKVRFANFQTNTRDHTIEQLINDAAEIRSAASQCLKRIDLTKRLRLLGVRVAGLEKVYLNSRPCFPIFGLSIR